MKRIFIISLIFCICWGQSSIHGIGTYYNTISVASAGFNGSYPNADSDQINPSGFAPLEPQLQLSVIKYPANIYAQSALYINSIKKGAYGISLRRINYGTFNEIDEFGIENGTYSASDTWLSGTIAKGEKRISWGISGGLFISNLESFNTTAVVFSVGILHGIKKVDAQIGLSVSNVGIFISRYTDYKEKLPQRITISGNKELQYLPLELNADISYEFSTKEIFVRFGGVFQLPYNFELIFGINSYNIDQSTEYRNIKSLLSSSGAGLAFSYKQYSIEFGGYSYGSGGWIYGTSFNFKL